MQAIVEDLIPITRNSEGSSKGHRHNDYAQQTRRLRHHSSRIPSLPRQRNNFATLCCTSTSALVSRYCPALILQPYTLLRSSSSPPTLLILSPYSAHPLPLLSSSSPHTLLFLSPYASHPLPLRSFSSPPTLFIPRSQLNKDYSHLFPRSQLNKNYSHLFPRSQLNKDYSHLFPRS